jgi:hypothetical protein
MRVTLDDAASELVESVSRGHRLPQVGLLRQRGEPKRLYDVTAATRAALAAIVADDPEPPGPIAVAVGSRGIAHIADIVGEVVSGLRAAGYLPFVVPAMGSHGGGNARGQTQVLADYGISEAALGVEVRATMDTEVIGTVDGLPVHSDRHVVAAGRCVLVCRIKPHTDFRGAIESGAAKMAAIGLGKRAGAQAVHARGPDGLRDTMPTVGRFVAARLVVGAVAIVENEFDETASISALGRFDIGAAGEAELLEQARALLPRIPVSDLDVLVVERFGKDISGTGLDPNVIGRWMVSGLTEPRPALARTIVALGLTPASHGNAIGIGLADFTTARVIEDIDELALYTNTLTVGWSGLQRARLPIVLPTDRDTVRCAAATCGRTPGEPVRLAWIEDTLHTRYVAVSEVLFDEAAGRADVELVTAPRDIVFDSAGRIAPFPEMFADARRSA